MDRSYMYLVDYSAGVWGYSLIRFKTWVLSGVSIPQKSWETKLTLSVGFVPISSSYLPSFPDFHRL